MSNPPDPQDRLSNLSSERRAALMQALRDRSVRRAAAESIPRRPRNGPAPLSFAQARLWFLDRLGPATSTYHMARALRLRGRVDVRALERALHEIVRRHGILRTTFVESAEGAVQVVASSSALPLPTVDLAALPEALREEEAARRAAEEVRRPFDMSRGPLLRALLMRLAGDDQVLVLTLHHIVGDGWSMGVLDREMAEIYGAFADGRPSPLPDPSIQYADFAFWQRERRQSAELRAQVDFWRKRLEGAPALLDLPHDRPRPPAPTFAGGRVTRRIPARRVEALRALGRRSGATPFMILLAPYLELLHRWCGQDDLCVGTPVAGRDQLETETLVGPFVNALVLRGDLSGGPTWIELLQRVRSLVGEALAHAAAPFEKLVEETRPERDPSVHPLFQTMLVLQDASAMLPDLPGLTAEAIDFETDTTPFDLTLILSEDAEGMEALLEYATDLFDRATIERMADHFTALVEALADDPEQLLSAVALPGLDAIPKRAGPETLPRGAPRAARETPRPAGPGVSASRATLRGDAQRTLARIWAGLLGREGFGPNDDFFDAGGHSLLALRLVSRVREELRVELPVRVVFERPTLGALAEWIDAARPGESVDRGRIEKAPRGRSLPVSFAQKRLWFIDQLQPGSAAYNIPLALRLRGRLDTDALERALAAMVARHEIMRTVFPLADGEPVQAIRPAGPVVLQRAAREGPWTWQASA